jgi:hypothetical protein
MNRVRANRYNASDYCYYYLTNKATGEVKIQEKEIVRAWWVSLEELVTKDTTRWITSECNNEIALCTHS